MNTKYRKEKGLLKAQEFSNLTLFPEILED